MHRVCQGPRRTGGQEAWTEQKDVWECRRPETTRLAGGIMADGRPPCPLSPNHSSAETVPWPRKELQKRPCDQRSGLATGRLQQGYSRDTPQLQQGYTTATPRLQHCYNTAIPRLLHGYSRTTTNLQQGYSWTTVGLQQSYTVEL